jgi:DNA polymerase-3 subunit beta
MKIVLTKADLARAVGRVQSVADRKSSLPILANILLTAKGDAVQLAATDLYLSATTVAKAIVENAGSIALPARTLFDIARQLPEGDVTIAADDTHRAEIRVGKVRFKVPGQPGRDFPSLPTPGEKSFAELPADVVARLIALVQYAMSSDDTRPHLAGTFVVRDGATLRMVTTDGHRLAKAEQRLETVADSFEMLVPGKGVLELKRLAEEGKGANISLASVGGFAFFKHGDQLLGVKLADDQFPPYQKVIPKGLDKRVVVPRDRLVTALKRMSLVASDKSGAVRFHLSSGALRIGSENPDVGEGSEELDVDYAGGELEIGFNAKYLLDAIGALQENDIALELGGTLDPGMVKPAVGSTDYVGVVMPMRI